MNPSDSSIAVEDASQLVIVDGGRDAATLWSGDLATFQQSR